MPSETGGLSDQARGDAQSALESAARHLRAVPRPVGAVPTREREILGGHQTRDLLTWARENSRLIDPGEYSNLLEPGGEEHRVWLDEARQVYFKGTYPGKFGYYVLSGSGGLPDLVAATPLEYLDRLLLENSLFGDTIELVGVCDEEGGLVVLTSQPNLVGGAVTPEEIIEFMRRLWFKELRGLSLGNPGSLSFYRDLQCFLQKRLNDRWKNKNALRGGGGAQRVGGVGRCAGNQRLRVERSAIQR